MKFVTLPNSELKVSQICLGTWQFNDGFQEDIQWEPQSYETSKAITDKAFELGVNFFDTAEGYRNSEAVLGRCLAGRRRDAIVATKFGYKNGPQTPPYTAIDIEQSLTESLRRLQTDYIDLYQVHWAPVLADAKEAVTELKRQVSLGRIRSYGVCNFGPKNLEELHAADGHPSTNQLPYNLLCRCIEFDIIPACRKYGLDILGYSPLQQGLLTGKFLRPEDVPEGRRRSRLFSKDSTSRSRHGDVGIEKQLFAAIGQMKAACDDAGLPMSNVALEWLCDTNFGGCSSVIVGCSRPDQLEKNCVQVNASQELLHKLTALGSEVKAALGPNIDLWAPKDTPRFA